MARNSVQHRSFVFISYARADCENFARRLYNDLKSDNIDVWLDIYDIPTALDWDAEIDNALHSARAMIVALTPGAVPSTGVKSEWSEALNRFLPVIPLKIKDCQIPRHLKVFQSIDFRYDYNVGIVSLRKCLHTLEFDFPEYLKNCCLLLKLHKKALLTQADSSLKSMHFNPQSTIGLNVLICNITV